jgi:beta-1,4-mannosyl-glycoprotein beta-1,4-N-acetylglucosaminyltransferase
MAVYDTFCFFNEVDLLLLRMSILDPYVDYFVISESPFTHSGKEKPLYFAENRNKFSKFDDKIIHNIFSYNRPEWNNWQREVAQRGGILGDAVWGLDDDDIIIVSDCDEIPNLEKIDLNQVEDTNNLFVSYQYLYYYYLNTITLANGRITPWAASRLSTWRLLRINSIDDLRRNDSYYCQNYPNEIIHVSPSGWHFSFLSDAENIKLKIQSFAHQEFNNSQVLDNVQKNMSELKDPFGREGASIKPIEMTLETHPAYLLNNISMYDKYIYKGA